MDKLLISAIAASVALALAPAGEAARIAATPPLPPGWSHAEINVIVKGVPHTLVYDHGRVQALSATSLTLRERDGSIVVINVSPTSQVKIEGRPASLSQVRRGEIATTLRIDGGDATKVTLQIPRAVAAAIAAELARGQAKQQAGGQGSSVPPRQQAPATASR